MRTFSTAPTHPSSFVDPMSQYGEQCGKRRGKQPLPPVRPRPRRTPSSAGTQPLFAIAVGLRDWALAHPAEFGLLFGAPVPDLLGDGYNLMPSHQAAMRFGAVFKDLVAELWHQQPFPIPMDEELGPELVDQLNGRSVVISGMPAGAIYLSLTAWFSASTGRRPEDKKGDPRALPRSTTGWPNSVGQAD
jgi:hypothetical protein